MDLTVLPEYVNLVENFLLISEDLSGVKEYKKALLNSGNPAEFGVETIATAFVKDFQPSDETIRVVMQFSAITYKDLVPAENVFCKILDLCDEETCKLSIYLICVYWAKRKGALKETSVNSGLLNQTQETDDRVEDWREQAVIDSIEGSSYEEEE